MCDVAKKNSLQTFLSPYERNYMKQMKRSDRSSIKKFFRKTTSTITLSEPVRLQVLRSHMPFQMKRNLFTTITEDCSEKNMQLVRTSLRIPYGVYSPTVDTNDSTLLKRAEMIMNDHISGHACAKREVLSVLAQWQVRGHLPFSLALEGAAESARPRLSSTLWRKC